MNKLKKNLILLLICSYSAVAQNETEQISDWYNTLKSTVSADGKEIYFTKMLQLKSANTSSLTDMLIDVSAELVAVAYAEENNFKKAIDFVAKINDAKRKDNAEIIIASSLIEKKNFKEAHILLDSKAAAITADQNGNKTPNKDQLGSSLTFGTLLFAESRFKETIPYLYPALQMDKYGKKYKETYVLSLLKTDSKSNHEDIVSSVYLAEGKNSETFKNEIQLWYKKIYGNDRKFQELEIKKQLDEKKHLEDLVAKMAVNKPAPEFEVLDNNGKAVSLASLRGKTVILDFWATWCQPCVASFPAMQKAVNYYKNDPSVVFMFIHTLEKKGADVKKQANDLLKAKNYNLDIYYDLRDQASGKSPVAEKFNIRSIPVKFVINKQGIIKFSNTGFIGEDEAIDEIKYMVEKANQ